MKVSALFSLVLAAVAIAAPHGRRNNEGSGSGEVAEHGVTTTEHGATVTEHGAMATEHGAATTEHGATTTEHGATTTEHGAATTEHGAATTEHGAATTEHGAATAEHGATTTEHGATTTEHGATTEEHGVEHETEEATEHGAEATGEVYRPAPPGSLVAGSRPIQLSQIQAIDVLQYALSAENLETAFYSNIQRFSAQDFEEAGFAPEIRERYLQIVQNEKTHIDVLKSVITAAGVKPVPACTYKFPSVDSVEAFVDVTHQFENVGAAAYTGAAPYITNNPAYLTAAAGILSTEARHAAWVGSTVFHQNPWNSPFETPLSFRQIWTIATEFVESCPEDMSYVPGFTDTFPRLKVDLTEYEATGKAKLSYTPAPGTESELEGKQLYVAFNQGSGVLYAPIDAETNEVTVPAGLKGFVFPLITSENGSVADEHVIAGPTVSQFGFASDGAALKAL